MELTNPDWLGDQTVPSEFGLRRRTKPGGVTGGVVVGGVDTSLPSAPLLASLRAIQVNLSYLKAYIHMFQDGSTLIPWTNSISGGRVLSVRVIIGLLGG